MRGVLLAALAVLLAPLPMTAATAQTIAAGRTIPSRSIITDSDLVMLTEFAVGTIRDPALITGMEALRIIYAGRPIRSADFGPPAVIERNDVISLSFVKGALKISTEGRALGRGGIGDRVRAMNLASRTTVTGVVTGPGQIRVLP
jgi:flagellar basal body P-ring formation protein FlgA